MKGVLLVFAAPSKHPNNVIIEGQLWHDRIRISWNQIPNKYLHGDLGGYRVIYKLMKIAGKSVLQSTAIRKEIHPSVTKVILLGLQANAQYTFQILGFNKYGDGVKTQIFYGGEIQIIAQ